ncbi:MAG: hypothetical protein CMQ40_05440 [Gammaproteobacteria bacterium]|nr:hypothetical protein [Gammaproteobacteria bacterium]
MLSIIIPTLNEARNIETLILQLKSQKKISLEIIISDGGSEDGTIEIGKALGAKIVSGPKGRGQQLNRGARSAIGEDYLFLHGDSELRDPDQLKKSLDFVREQKGPVAGHYQIDFACDDPTVKKFLRFFEIKSIFNREGTFAGDQGLLISRKTFEEMEGFSEELTFLEDKEFGERFFRKGKFVTLPGRIRSSARRFEVEGMKERAILNLLIMSMHHLRLDNFFESASYIYRESSEAGKLDLLPFFIQALHELMRDGSIESFRKFSRLGRWANSNIWQSFLWLGLKTKREHRLVKIYDNYFAKHTRNFFGDALSTLAIIIWFFAKLLSQWTRNKLGKFF